MDYLFLDEVQWQYSQAFYHAACYLGREILFILRPAIKVAEGVSVIQNLYKAVGGLIRATAVNSHGVLTGLYLSGDFFFYPPERLADLETALVGITFERGAIEKKISDFYVQNKIEAPGVEPMDIARSIQSS